MSDDDNTWPKELREAEQKMLGCRRERAYPDPEAEPLAEAFSKAGRVGLALSGGGIRSATLSLGFLQALAAAEWLPHLDYLSTVSGGSYAGSFLGALFQPRDAQGKRSRATPDQVKDALGQRSFPVRWLRENGRYLAPAGASDGWIAVAVVLRNLLAIHAVLGTFALTLFLAAAATRAGLGAALRAALDATGHGSVWTSVKEAWVSPHMWLSPWLALTAILFALLCVPPGVAYWFIAANVSEDGGRRPGRAYWRPHWTGIGVLVILVGWFAFQVVRVGAWAAVSEPRGQVQLGLAVLLALSLTVWSRLHGTDQQARNLVTGWLRTGLIVTTAALAWAVVDTLGQTLYAQIAIDGGRPRLLRMVGAWFAGIGTLAGLVQKAKGLLGSERNGHVALPYRALALVAALLVVGALLVGLDAVAHGLAHGWAWPLQRGVLPDCWPTEVVMRGGVHGLAVDPLKPEEGFIGHAASVSWLWLGPALAVGAVLTFAFSRSYAFLNRSSLSSLYAARLTRTYLGASNRRRDDEINRNVTRTIPGDELELVDYVPHLGGGPLHIINTTLNETVPAQSQVEQRDRHGMNLAVGPSGISVGVRHHAVWDTTVDNPNAESRGSRLQPVAEALNAQGFRLFARAKASSVASDAESADGIGFLPEPLSLGQWVAISGAAVSTGLGARTSVGLSLLTGIVNARLGRWWSSGVDPERQQRRSDYENNLRRMGRFVARLLPVHAHLLDELLARFHGPSSASWYLTDGGHFENTGVYELIRRRVELIFVCDNGADGEHRFSDLADLTRKARIDFATKIEFVPAAILQSWREQHHPLREIANRLGTLDDFGLGERDPGHSATSPAYATVAKIEYPDTERPGLLVVAKPRCTGYETLDVREYAGTNPDFPQQSTADQFFDDRQWESYRKLGEIIGTSIFSVAEIPLDGETDGPASGRTLPWPLWLLRQSW